MVFPFYFLILLYLGIQRPGEFVFRICLCIISINFAPFFCKQFVAIISLISLAIRELGENLLNQQICFYSVIQNLNSTVFINSDGFNLFSIDGLIKGFISIGLINLSLSYALRYIMIKVIILLSPFAFLSLCLKESTWFFKSWLKILFSLLVLQILVSIILFITLSLNYSNDDLFSKILYVGSIYSLMRANTYIREIMGGISTDISVGLSNIKSLFSGGSK